MASGHNRTINRRKFQSQELEALLGDPSTRSARVFRRLKQFLKIRREQPAFHPHGTQQVVSCPPEVFGLLRISPDGKEQVLCLQNTSNRRVEWDTTDTFDQLTYDLIRGATITGNHSISMAAYQTLWLVERKD